VADYPFTTLEPVLGVVEMGWRQFVVADIPGLIEGAHEGAGLGLDFLRHIERTNVILHLVDGASDDPVRDYERINEELREYGVGLQDKPQLLAVNKIDIEEVRDRMGEIEEAFQKVGTEVRFISGASGEGVSEVVSELGRIVQERRAPESADEEAEEPEEVQTILVRQRVEVREENGGYRVEGERIITFAEMMPLGVDEGIEELWRRFGRWGVTSALKRAGARVGDKVYVGSAELEMHA
jgi:GTP-binding protein